MNTLIRLGTAIVDGLRRQRTRAYLYRTLGAIAPVLVFYGVVSNEEAAVLMGAAGGLLGVGLAIANTTTKEDSP